LACHVVALEGVRHPWATPYRRAAARDYVAPQLRAIGLAVELAPLDYDFMAKVTEATAGAILQLAGAEG
jgi:hypothetical protein